MIVHRVRCVHCCACGVYSVGGLANVSVLLPCFAICNVPDGAVAGRMPLT